jgi:23S rRNA (pseudouridine1915-N3)-methyltransferase
MFKVKVITIGKCKEAWLASALAEYEKRLEKNVRIEWAIAKNDDQLVEWALQEQFLIPLDPAGELFTSESLSQKLRRLFEEKGSRLTFAIGGAEGLPAAILNRFPFRLSLSTLTFTHQITRLILVEQIYRAMEIEKGSGYHK